MSAHVRPILGNPLDTPQGYILPDVNTSNSFYPTDMKDSIGWKHIVYVKYKMAAVAKMAAGHESHQGVTNEAYDLLINLRFIWCRLASY